MILLREEVSHPIHQYPSRALIRHLEPIGLCCLRYKDFQTSVLTRTDG